MILVLKWYSYGVLTTPEEFEGRDDRFYKTLKEEGVFELKLKFRGWYRKAFSIGLICYFETVEDGTWWRCTVEKNEKGKYTWVDAEPTD